MVPLTEDSRVTAGGAAWPSIQRTPDPRGIAIDEVGVGSIRYPLQIPLRDGGVCHTVAEVSMRVSLPHYEKGTHMSRFMIALEERQHELRPEGIDDVLLHLREALDADTAYLDVRFPIFLERPAPVTGIVGRLDYDCHIGAALNAKGLVEKRIGVVVNAASLCPCSREISDRGAHNQRSRIAIELRPTGNEFIWFEDLVEIAEASASCQLYPILKRPDEKHVTERAYDNPKFVEDIVRDVALKLAPYHERGVVAWYRVQCTNFESIHNHDAVARIERGEQAKLLRCEG
jgi:GTP cyclohydrolase I